MRLITISQVLSDVEIISPKNLFVVMLQGSV